MAKKSVRSLTESLALKQKEHRWNKVVTALAAVVVFCTTYALILPAITMEREPLCGLEEHVHTAECYQMPMELSCSCQLEAMAGTAPVVVHTHNEYCYDAQGNLVCALPEVLEHQHGDSCYSLVPVEGGHFHDDSCYTERQEQTCGLSESEGHTHEPGCYTDTLVCTIPENHVHGDGCYEDILICTDESEEHVHDPACYEHRLICTIPENHVHGEGCYETTTVCGLEENPGHAHGPACCTTVRDLTCTEPEGQFDKVLTCTRQEIIVHTHSAACYNEAGQLICPMQQIYEHVHGPECWTPVAGAEEAPICGMEEHEHTDACFSDEFADVETAEDWEATLPKELTGKWVEDVLAVAYSQLGYQESSVNVIFDENGDPQGYTRYGAFMGRPYDDWCAHFVDFVHHYAGLPIDAFPQYPGCARWCDKLEEDNFGVYFKPEEYEPQPGDCIFFDMDEMGGQDHMGIVEKIVPATEEEPAKVQTIEGNSGNCVQQVLYELDDPRILGYASIAAAKERYDRLHPTYHCGLEEHSHSDDCYDAEGQLICELPEHTHTEACLSETVYYCGLEEHVHGDACYDEEGSLICEIPEHTHEAACLIEVVYYCGMGEHTHGDACYDEENNLICTIPEHTHVDACRIPLVYYCGKEAHAHTEECYDEEGNLICELEEHTHDEMCLLQEQTVEAQIIAPVNPFAEGGEQTTIQVTGLMPPGAVVEASPVYLGEEYGNVICAYNITIYDGEGNVFEPLVPLQVTLTVPGLDMSENAEYTVFNVPKQPQEEPVFDIQEPAAEDEPKSEPQEEPQSEPQDDAALAAPAEGDMGIMACAAALPQGQMGIMTLSAPPSLEEPGPAPGPEPGNGGLANDLPAPQPQSEPAQTTQTDPTVSVNEIRYTLGADGSFNFTLTAANEIIGVRNSSKGADCPSDPCKFDTFLDYWTPTNNDHPFGGAQDFNVFLLGDLGSWGAIHGNLAVGGNITAGNSGVGYFEGSNFDYAADLTAPNDICLLLGGTIAQKVEVSNGSVLKHKAVDSNKIGMDTRGNKANHIHNVDVAFSESGGLTQNDPFKLWFEQAGAADNVPGSLKQHNTHIHEYASSTRVQTDGHIGDYTVLKDGDEIGDGANALPGYILLKGENQFYNIFNLPAEYATALNSQARVVYLDIPADSYAIINIDGKQLTADESGVVELDNFSLQLWYRDSNSQWQKQPAIQNAEVGYNQSQMVLVNFDPKIDQVTCTVGGDYLYASVMGPNVDLKVTGGMNLHGTIVLNSMDGNINSHAITNPFLTGSSVTLWKQTVCDHPDSQNHGEAECAIYEAGTTGEDGHTLGDHIPKVDLDNDIDERNHNWNEYYADVKFRITNTSTTDGVTAIKKRLPLNGSSWNIDGLSPGTYRFEDEVIYKQVTVSHADTSTEGNEVKTVMLTVDENGYWMRVRYGSWVLGEDGKYAWKSNPNAKQWTLTYCEGPNDNYDALIPTKLDANGFGEYDYQYSGEITLPDSAAKANNTEAFIPLGHTWNYANFLVAGRESPLLTVVANTADSHRDMGVVNHYDMEPKKSLSVLKRWYERYTDASGNEFDVEVAAPVNASVEVTLMQKKQGAQAGTPAQYEVQVLNEEGKYVTQLSTEPLVLSAENSWFGTWPGLTTTYIDTYDSKEKEYVYYVEEKTDVPGYNSVHTELDVTNGTFENEYLVHTELFNKNARLFTVKNWRKNIPTGSLKALKLWYDDNGSLMDSSDPRLSGKTATVQLYRKSGTVTDKADLDLPQAKLFCVTHTGEGENIEETVTSCATPQKYYDGSDVFVSVTFDVEANQHTLNNNEDYLQMGIYKEMVTIRGHALDNAQVSAVSQEGYVWDGTTQTTTAIYHVTITGTLKGLTGEASLYIQPPKPVGTKYITQNGAEGDVKYTAEVKTSTGSIPDTWTSVSYGPPTFEVRETVIADRWIDWNYNLETDPDTGKGPGITEVGEYNVEDDQGEITTDNGRQELTYSGEDPFSHTWKNLPGFDPDNPNTRYRYYVLELPDGLEGEYNVTYNYGEVGRFYTDLGFNGTDNAAVNKIQTENKTADDANRPEPYPGVTGGFITVQNRPAPQGGPVLPDCGGIGTHLYTFGGLFVSLLALLYMFKNRRKEVFPS